LISQPLPLEAYTIYKTYTMPEMYEIYTTLKNKNKKLNNIAIQYKILAVGSWKCRKSSYRVGIAFSSGKVSYPRRAAYNHKDKLN
jgi:hypothetical protein